MVYWKQFMAGWRREHDAIPGNTRSQSRYVFLAWGKTQPILVTERS